MTTKSAAKIDVFVGVILLLVNLASLCMILAAFIGFRVVLFIVIACINCLLMVTGFRLLVNGINRYN